jgi:hypothetical protein
LFENKKERRENGKGQVYQKASRQFALGQICIMVMGVWLHV